MSGEPANFNARAMARWLASRGRPNAKRLPPGPRPRSPSGRAPPTLARGHSRCRRRNAGSCQRLPAANCASPMRMCHCRPSGLHRQKAATQPATLRGNQSSTAISAYAVLRRLALNVARAYPDVKTSLRGKIKRAGWDETFLFDMLRHMR
jgi:hypothetical protein